MKLKLAQVLLALAWLRSTQCAPTLDLPLGLDLPLDVPTVDLPWASPQASKVTLPFARRINTADPGSASVVRFDQARAEFFRDRADGKFAGVTTATEAMQAAKVFHVPATAQVVSYVAEVRS